MVIAKYLNYFTDQYLALQDQHLCKVHVILVDGLWRNILTGTLCHRYSGWIIWRHCWTSYHILKGPQTSALCCACFYSRSPQTTIKKYYCIFWNALSVTYSVVLYKDTAFNLVMLHVLSVIWQCLPHEAAKYQVIVI